MQSGVWKELVLWKWGDVDRPGNGVRTLSDGGGIMYYDKEVGWGVETSDDVAWLYRLWVVLVVCKIMGRYSNGTSEHEKWFEGGRRSVYKERLLGVGGFPFLLSLLILLYSKASMTLNQLWLLSCLDHLITNFETLCSDYDITLLLPISPTSNPDCYAGTSPSKHNWYWMYCQHCLTRCFDLVWYYCKVTKSYILICYQCSHELANSDVPAPFERL